jgi:hypothetical protein
MVEGARVRVACLCNGSKVDLTLRVVGAPQQSQWIAPNNSPHSCVKAHYFRALIDVFFPLWKCANVR